MDPLKGLDTRRGLDALTDQKSADVLNKTKTKTKEGAQKAATDFEALLVHQMINSMWSSVPKNPLFGGGNEDEIYRDMYTDAISKNIAENQSLGIRDVVLKELTKKGEELK